MFASQGIQPPAASRFATGVELFGYPLPVAAGLGIVTAFAVLFTALSVRTFGKPE